MKQEYSLKSPTILQPRKYYDRPTKTEGGIKFEIVSEFEPAGDQPQAIKALTEGINNGLTDQVLLGVTGSGKTYTMAKIIEGTQRPALIMAHNKTLAAQLYGEMKNFFPNNSVQYFVSYYDYYQPEAYVPRSDTFIEKDASINESIDRMRHAATRAIFERDDVIIVASVSCIYGMGAAETYLQMAIQFEQGMLYDQRKLLRDLVALHYKRNDMAFTRGAFRVRGDVIEIFPSHFEGRAWRLNFFGDELEKMTLFDPLTGEKIEELKSIKVYANSHYVTPGPSMDQAIKTIKTELDWTLKDYANRGMVLEAARLEQRTKFDLEMLAATGVCAGIENYSRHLTGRNPGEAPPTLFEYLPQNMLLFMDESHVSVPQIGGMSKGDYSRKSTLAKFGFRLPSCLDNRPLKFSEWQYFRPQSIYVSATPGKWELEQTAGEFVEQVIRPTGLIDPPVEIHPVESQVDDLLHEVRGVIKAGHRVLVTTLTKRMAEDLSEYMYDNGLKVRYMHSDIETLERIEIIRDLRLGVFDILIGINLLREGLDIPETGLVAILDADKEGFLRSETSLIQTIGRAARNVGSKVILYADKETRSIKAAMRETDRRREIQKAFNVEHGITPKSINKKIGDIIGDTAEGDHVTVSLDTEGTNNLVGHNLRSYIEGLEKTMLEAAGNLEFEEAARIRDEIKHLEEKELGIEYDPMARNIGASAPKGRSTLGKPGTRQYRKKSKHPAKRTF